MPKALAMNTPYSREDYEAVMVILTQHNVTVDEQLYYTSCDPNYSEPRSYSAGLFEYFGVNPDTGTYMSDNIKNFGPDCVVVAPTNLEAIKAWADENYPVAEEALTEAPALDANPLYNKVLVLHTFGAVNLAIKALREHFPAGQVLPDVDAFVEARGDYPAPYYLQVTPNGEVTLENYACGQIYMGISNDFIEDVMAMCPAEEEETPPTTWVHEGEEFKVLRVLSDDYLLIQRELPDYVFVDIDSLEEVVTIATSLSPLERSVQLRYDTCANPADWKNPYTCYDLLTHFKDKRYQKRVKALDTFVVNRETGEYYWLSTLDLHTLGMSEESSLPEVRITNDGDSYDKAKEQQVWSAPNGGFVTSPNPTHTDGVYLVVPKK